MGDEFTENEQALMRRGFPAALAKALLDPFDYAIGLTDGTVIRFGSAKEIPFVVGDEWVTLTDVDETSSTLRFPCPRGVDVRLSQIAWVTDAPLGS